MNLQPSDEQIAIAVAAGEFLGKELPIERVRALANNTSGKAIDEATWRRCADLGWLGMTLPEEVGGSGLGLPEEVMLFRELGRHLTPGPYLSSTTAALVAAASGKPGLAMALASGERRAGLATGGFGIDVHPGDLLLVLDSRGGELFEVDLVDQVTAIDPGSRLAKVTTGVPVARADDSYLLHRARVLAAAELLGIIEAVRDMSASYARTRFQFGKPIGAFQAVKHRCADMAIAAYATTGEIYQAALLVDARTQDAAFHAAAAYLLAVAGASASTAANIQNHGGIGFTWEHDAHLFLKRAFALERVLEGPRGACDAVLAPTRHEFL